VTDTEKHAPKTFDVVLTWPDAADAVQSAVIGRNLSMECATRLLSPPSCHPSTTDRLVQDGVLRADRKTPTKRWADVRVQIVAHKEAP
jgi:hypothetical protein